MSDSEDEDDENIVKCVLPVQSTHRILLRNVTLDPNNLGEGIRIRQGGYVQFGVNGPKFSQGVVYQNKNGQYILASRRRKTSETREAPQYKLPDKDGVAFKKCTKQDWDNTLDKKYSLDRKNQSGISIDIKALDDMTTLHAPIQLLEEGHVNTKIDTQLVMISIILTRYDLFRMINLHIYKSMNCWFKHAANFDSKVHIIANMYYKHYHSFYNIITGKWDRNPIKADTFLLLTKAGPLVCCNEGYIAFTNDRGDFNLMHLNFLSFEGDPPEGSITSAKIGATENPDTWRQLICSHEQFYYVWTVHTKPAHWNAIHRMSMGAESGFLVAFELPQVDFDITIDENYEKFEKLATFHTFIFRNYLVVIHMMPISQPHTENNSKYLAKTEIRCCDLSFFSIPDCPRKITDERFHWRKIKSTSVGRMIPTVTVDKNHIYVTGQDGYFAEDNEEIYWQYLPNKTMEIYTPETDSWQIFPIEDNKLQETDTKIAEIYDTY